MNEGDTPARCRLGALIIDLQRSSVRGHASPSDLTPRAEALLLLLARNANEVVSPDDILRTVWAGRVVEEAVISHCVWQIRKALGPQGKHILQNRTKRGYVLVVPEEAWCTDPSPGKPGGTGTRVVPMAGDAAADHPLADLPPGRSEGAAVDSAPPADASAASAFPPSDANPGADDDADPDPSLDSDLDRDPVPSLHAGRYRHLRRRAWVVAVLLCCVFVLIGYVTWLRAPAPSADAIARIPDSEMTVMIEAPEEAPWLRRELLTLVVEEAYLHGAEVLAFESRQKHNPFSGPHFEVRSLRYGGGSIEAELLIRQGGFRAHRRFRGSPRGLVDAARAFLRAHLPEPTRARSDAVDSLASALTSDSMYDRQAALLDYRRALARDPGLVEATLGMASSLMELGREREALAALTALGSGEGLTEAQRCRREVRLAQIEPEALPDDVCAEAARILWTDERRAKPLLRALPASAEQNGGAGQWLHDELNAIQALIDLREFDQAKSRIAEGERIASDAGWESGRARIAAFKSRFALEDGRVDESLALLRESLRAHEALGDLHSVVAFRTLLIQRSPLVPGPTMEKKRTEILEVVDMARRIGSVRGEVDALRALMRLDRDRPDRWRSHRVRIEQLTGQAYAPRRAAEEQAYTLQELLTQRMYGEAIEGVDRMQASGRTFSQTRLWNLTTLAEAHFFQDELPEALAAIDAMHSENFDISYTSPCVFAWLSVEADRPDLHAMMADKCPHRTYDPMAKATRGVYSILADARAHVRRGEPQRAWPLLRPHIDELMALAEPTRQQLQALTLLSRYAVALPGSDPAKLRRALGLAEPLAGLDGAGPTLRFNVHTLRWRLCMADRRSDCGPALPEWAPEDRFEARLAAEYAAALKRRS